MCGIAGWLGGLDDAGAVVSRVQQALYHRGPDGRGSNVWDDGGLVHTRLSIIDLSECGAQPMANEDATVWAVFNGEIYNHRELRRWLEGRGHTFRGRSDSEVIPHLYEEEGADFLPRLRGMFALAVMDLRRRRMVLARDRFGIKPLFYTATGSATATDTAARRRPSVAFASEIPALLEFGGIDERPDPQAIFDFAALSYIPSPLTFYKGVASLEPGRVMEVSLGPGPASRRTRAFHRWTVAPDPFITMDAAVDRAAELISGAVAAQVESDVPLGTLLSGGIDSSLVSAAAARGAPGSLSTFNVRFPDAAYDETWAALEAARHVSSRHTVLDMDSGVGTWSYVSDLLSQFGQPFADTSVFAVNQVCRLMRAHVTVALSGDGGDEGFGGYNWHRQAAGLARAARLPPWSWRLAAAGLGRVGGGRLVSPDAALAVGDLAGADDATILEYLLCWVGPTDHAALCVGGDLLPVRRHFEAQWEHRHAPGATRVDRISSLGSEVGTRLILANDFLPKVDVASMKESLEVRVPMLDEDLFEFGLSLPHHLRVRRRQAKVVLRAVAERQLPPRVAAKPKHGFGVPVDTWVDAGFKAHVREVLLSADSGLGEYFRDDAYRPLVAAFCDDRSLPGISRQELFLRVTMMLAVHLALENARTRQPRPRASTG